MITLRETVKGALAAPLARAHRLISQARSRRPKKRGAEQGWSTSKICSWHPPEGAYISKGKARAPYEFGAKVSVATSVQGNLVVGTRAFGGNPFDEHTLAEQMEQTLQDRGIKPGTVYVDLEYHGVDHDNLGIQINHRGKWRRLNEAELRLLKRRQSIEPVVGHLKHDHRMDRYHLKGEPVTGFTLCCTQPVTTSVGCLG